MFTKIMLNICVKKVCPFVGSYNEIRYNSCVLYNKMPNFLRRVAKYRLLLRHRWTVIIIKKMQNGLREKVLTIEKFKKRLWSCYNDCYSGRTFYFNGRAFNSGCFKHAADYREY